MKRLTVLASLLFLATACETADDNNIEAARTCINNAMRTSVTNAALAATQATSCELLTRNMTTSESGKLGFMAILIMEQKISELANSAGALAGSSNTVGTSLSYMAFSTVTNINQMDTYVSRAGSSGITKMGSLIKAATILKSVVGTITAGTEISSANLTTFMGTATTAEKDATAAALIALQQSTCSGAGASSPTCTKVTQAVGTDPTTATVLTTLQTFLGGAG